MAKIKPGISQGQICEARRLCQAGRELGITIEERWMLYPTQASRNQKYLFEMVSLLKLGFNLGYRPFLRLEEHGFQSL